MIECQVVQWSFMSAFSLGALVGMIVGIIIEKLMK